MRSKTNRNLADGVDLYKSLEQADVCGTYTIELPSDSRKHQYSRKVEMELRFGEVDLKRPDNPAGKDYPASFKLRGVYAREVGKNSRPINRKLLTTHEINSFDDALRMVQWYGKRWYIEQVFRILKKQGLDIEHSQLESGWSIRKLAVMELTAAIKILQLNITFNKEGEGQPVEEVFDEEQIEVPGKMNKTLQGSTEKQKNPFNSSRLKWASRVIGRMGWSFRYASLLAHASGGGRMGYKCEGPPGVIVIKRGLDKLNTLVEGVKIAIDIYTL